MLLSFVRGCGVGAVFVFKFVRCSDHLLDIALFARKRARLLSLIQGGGFRDPLPNKTGAALPTYRGSDFYPHGRRTDYPRESDQE